MAYNPTQLIRFEINFEDNPKIVISSRYIESVYILLQGRHEQFWTRLLNSIFIETNRAKRLGVFFATAYGEDSG